MVREKHLICCHWLQLWRWRKGPHVLPHPQKSRWPLKSRKDNSPLETPKNSGLWLSPGKGKWIHMQKNLNFKMHKLHNYVITSCFLCESSISLLPPLHNLFVKIFSEVFSMEASNTLDSWLTFCSCFFSFIGFSGICHLFPSLVILFPLVTSSVCEILFYPFWLYHYDNTFKDSLCQKEWEWLRNQNLGSAVLVLLLYPFG